MTREEFLNSILTKKQIADIKCAIKQKQPILIAHTNSHGKTALREYLRKLGAIVYEPHEMHVVEIHKDVQEFIPNVLDTLEDWEG
jgi:uncharacterized protein YvpB